jgi:hypothetical protein
MLRPTLVALAGVLALSACAEQGGVQQDTTADPPDAGVPANPLTGDPLPPLDTSRTVAALEDVHFDTFTGDSVPLAEADDALVDRLRDAIAPVYRPDYEDAETAAAWLADDDLVIGLAGDDGTYAYPHRILNLHEIVHEQVDGVPVLVSYCPLCGSGVVYDRRHGERTLTFGNTSALYDSDLVMFDWETNSYWWQVPGLAIVGELAGESLTPLASQTTTFAEWRALHPDTAVLSRPGPAERYDYDPFASLPEFLDSGGEPFPISEAAKDGRLDPSTVVIGVEIDGEHHVYPVELLGGRVVQDTVGDQPIVIVGSTDGEDAAAFIARADGADLTFEPRAGVVVDRETGSTWDRAGRATGGPLAGTQLAGAPSRTTFWFAYVAAFPDLELRIPDETE